MDLAIIRYEYRRDGIFGELRDTASELICYTLEAAYFDVLGSVYAKMPEGLYTCVKGMHKLEATGEPVETFEIMNVPGHSGLLFRPGTFSRDSLGDVILGMSLTQVSGRQAIVSSRLALKTFMTLQKEIDQFTLVVTSHGDC